MVSKKVVDAGAQSKTAKKSQGKKKEEGFIASGDVDRIISLCGGQFAYILDTEGKTHHVKVGSEKYSNLVTVLQADQKHGARVAGQLKSLGWLVPMASEALEECRCSAMTPAVLECVKHALEAINA